ISKSRTARAMAPQPEGAAKRRAGDIQAPSSECQAHRSDGRRALSGRFLLLRELLCLRLEDLEQPGDALAANDGGVLGPSRRQLADGAGEKHVDDAPVLTVRLAQKVV